MDKIGWKAYQKADGSVMIAFADESVITVKNDGITGYSFVLEYLCEISKHYKKHLEAVDMMLRRIFGNGYENMRRIQNVYNANLAVLSLNCTLTRLDHQLDYDDGEFYPKFCKCPSRCTCQFNGYNPKLSDKQIVCCNPIYETGLTPMQLQVAKLLVNTGFANNEIAERLSISEKSVRNHCTHIYNKMQVLSRVGLRKKLLGKRIL